MGPAAASIRLILSSAGTSAYSANLGIDPAPAVNNSRRYPGGVGSFPFPFFAQRMSWSSARVTAT